MTDKRVCLARLPEGSALHPVRVTVKRPKNPEGRAGNRFRNFYGVIRSVERGGHLSLRSDLPFTKAARPGIWSSGIKKCEKTYLTSSPAPWHTGAHVDSSRKGYANAKRAVWKLFLLLSLPPPSISLSRSLSLYLLSLLHGSPRLLPPSLWSFHKSHAARQVGSLLRNGFPDFFAVIKGSRDGVGNDQRDFHHETWLDGLPDTRDQPLLDLAHDLSCLFRSLFRSTRR